MAARRGGLQGCQKERSVAAASACSLCPSPEARHGLQRRGAARASRPFLAAAACATRLAVAAGAAHSVWGAWRPRRRHGERQGHLSCSPSRQQPHLICPKPSGPNPLHPLQHEPAVKIVCAAAHLQGLSSNGWPSSRQTKRSTPLSAAEATGCLQKLPPIHTPAQHDFCRPHEHAFLSNTHACSSIIPCPLVFRGQTCKMTAIWPHTGRALRPRNREILVEAHKLENSGDFQIFRKRTVCSGLHVGRPEWLFLARSLRS